jgi:hypothetical protein
MITNTPLAVAFAKAAITERMEQGHFNIVDLMKAAAIHVDTMHRETRMDLRSFILVNGGTLEPPSAEIIEVARHPPTMSAVLYSEAKPNQCRFPVGTWRVFNAASNLCCGQEIPYRSNSKNITISRYCAKHARIATQPGSARKAPPIIPPSARTNLAYKSKGRRGSPRLEGY